ncbi:MAG: efflux RND transporter periplasmic adaptor subunit [Proteobacteria bacterium]|nr:efflux RND transporter periplasmic adaptor subunit [Pseudomonadota bacterium]
MPRPAKRGTVRAMRAVGRTVARGGPVMANAQIRPAPPGEVAAPSPALPAPANGGLPVPLRRASARGRKVSAGWIAAGALAATAAGGAWWLLKPIDVRLTPAVTGQAVDAVYASGVVEYVRQAHVAPVLTAPIVRVAVEEGQDVRAGQTLAQLDDGPQQQTVLQLEAQAVQARAVADRAHRLLLAGFGAKATDDDAQALKAAAEAAAASARARLGDYRLTAPFPGRILRRDAEPGDLAATGAPLFVIADLRAVRITADVDERDVGRLAVGQQAVVRADAFPQQVFQARITEITPQGDATGRIFRVRLALPTDSPLKPGMTVETNLITARRDRAVLVPTAALSKGAVWTAVDGHARRIPVKTGASDPNRTEILRGLAPGRQVITNPPPDLKDGARVSVRPAG